jgi:hypothetical protein
MNPNTAIVILGAVAGILLVLGGWLLIGRRRTPEEIERARRLFLSARGRIVEAEITDVHGTLVGYSYDVAGVTYHVVQDLQPFLDVLPRDPNLLIGPAMAKYSTGNPGNSILVSEEWSGVRMARPIPMAKQKGA